MTTLYRRRAGVTERTLGGAVFLAHRGRATVCRLNDTGSALWRLLRSPLSADEAVAVFQQAFPDDRPREVAQRVRDLLDTLVDDELAERVAAPARRARRAARGAPRPGAKR